MLDEPLGEGRIFGNVGLCRRSVFAAE